MRNNVLADAQNPPAGGLLARSAAGTEGVFGTGSGLLSPRPSRCVSEGGMKKRWYDV